jgi:ubiquinone/menaquinone biosynthesis C-methylase UbiE
MSPRLNNSDVDKSGWSAAKYNQTASFVYSDAFTAPVLELLSAKPGERIIDIGCGSGEVTLAIKKVVDAAEGGHVIGIDASQSMVSRSPHDPD